MDDHSGNSDGEEENLALKRLEADLSTELKTPDGAKVDLFSEIHLNELKKLEKQLESLESEKSHLTSNLREAQTSLDKSQNELQNFMARILAAHVESLVELKKQIEGQQDSVKKGQPTDNINDKLRNVVTQYNNWFNLSSKEIDLIRADLVELQNGLKYSDAMFTLRNEITNLKNKLISNDHKLLDLQNDVQTLTNISQNAGQSLGYARSTLVALSDDLAQLYHLVCTVNGEIPTRVLLDHKSDDMSFENDSVTTIQSQFRSEILTTRSHFVEDLQSLADSVEINKYVEILSDQIKYLKNSVEHTIDLNKNKVRGTVNDDKYNREEVEELQEQIIKLKSLLSTKREQIATLRTVLKSNKQTAISKIKYPKDLCDNNVSAVEEVESDILYSSPIELVLDPIKKSNNKSKNLDPIKKSRKKTPIKKSRKKTSIKKSRKKTPIKKSRKKTPNSDTLSSHKSQIYYTCDLCDKKFKFKQSLVIHSRTHTGERPFDCPNCNKKFRRKSSLRIHSRIHTGEKPYRCQYCSKSFNTYSNSKVHERLHGIYLDLPYECLYCQKRFNQKTAFKIHERKHETKCVNDAAKKNKKSILLQLEIEFIIK